MKTKQKIHHLEPQQQSALSILEQPGQELDAQTRAILEPRFNHSFADVRVHHNASAARAADDFGACAFAVGQDIVMNAGEYDPRSRAGLELLTHELTHTIQQRGARGDAPLEIAKRSSGMEVEARETRDRVMGGDSAPRISSGAALSVAREKNKFADSVFGQALDLYSNDALGLLPGMMSTAGDLSDAALRTAYVADDATALIHSGVTAGANVPGMSATSSALAPLRGLGRAASFAAPLSLYGGAYDSAQDIANLQSGRGSVAENVGNLTSHGASAFSGAVGTAGLLGSGATALGGMAAFEGTALGAGLAGGGGTVTAGATALGPAAALAGSFAGGYTIGTALNEHTAIGDYTSDYIGMTSELFGGGDRNWLLNQTDSFDSNVTQGNYGSAAIDGLQIGGTAALGTLGGAAAWAGSSIADGARGLWDLL